MTDKQIIIGGVDVSGCEFYCDGCCTELTDSYGDYIDKCTEYNNCYYKQLKRKEQECERLKEKLNPKLKNAHCTYFEGQTGLCKAKEFTKCNPVNCKLYTIDELSTIVELQQQLDQLKAENEGLKKNYFTVIQQRNKAEQTLTEIKELIQSEYCIVIGSCEICDEVRDCINGKILQKISECEVEK